MTSHSKNPKFKLIEINPFDARGGYKRCSLPGIGCSWAPNPLSPFKSLSLIADFWRNRTGGLVVRFSSNQPYVFHFKATLASGEPVPEDAIEEFAEFIERVLIEWGGADDPPDTELSF